MKGLEASMPLGAAAERIVSLRLSELEELAREALERPTSDALHDTRIAAKRLRYVLEFSGSCFGAYAGEAAKRARDIQDTLGALHDSEVLAEYVLARHAELRAEDAVAVARRAGRAKRLDPSLALTASHRAAYRGFSLLVVHLEAQRELDLERFRRLWRKLEREDFGGRLREALGQPPVAVP